VTRWRSREERRRWRRRSSRRRRRRGSRGGEGAEGVEERRWCNSSGDGRVDGCRRGEREHHIHHSHSPHATDSIEVKEGNEWGKDVAEVMVVVCVVWWNPLRVVENGSDGMGCDDVTRIGREEWMDAGEERRGEERRERERERVERARRSSLPLPTLPLIQLLPNICPSLC
jgi:hypothetical protein